MISDGSFTRPVGGKGGWSTENADVARAGGAGIMVGSAAKGFIYQRVERAAHGSAAVVASAWVYSSTPGTAFLELSDRKGTDIKGAPHPGDGRWRLLELEAGPLSWPDGVEFRVVTIGAQAYVKDASFLPANIYSRRRSLEMPGADGFKRLLAVIVVPLFASAGALAADNLRQGIGPRLLAASFALLSVSATMLAIGEPQKAALAANIGVALGSTVLIIGWAGGGAYRAMTPLFRFPGSIPIGLSIAMLPAVVACIAAGAKKEAELAAKASYLLFVAGAVSIAAQRAWQWQGGRRRLAGDACNGPFKEDADEGSAR